MRAACQATPALTAAFTAENESSIAMTEADPALWPPEPIEAAFRSALAEFPPAGIDEPEPEPEPVPCSAGGEAEKMP